MITSLERKLLLKKHLKEGMSIKDINKYFENLLDNLKSSKKKVKKIKPDFKEKFKELYQI